MDNIRDRPPSPDARLTTVQRESRCMPNGSTPKPVPAARKRRLGLAGSWPALLADGAHGPALRMPDGQPGDGVDTTPTDYRQRHPIALAYAPTDLDLFVGRNSGRFDPRQAQDLQHFAGGLSRERARTDARPGAGRTGRARGASQGVRSRSRRARPAGVPRGMIRLQTYSAPDKLLASPIRLSFTKLQAKVHQPVRRVAGRISAGRPHPRWLAEPALPQFRLRLSDRARKPGRRSRSTSSARAPKRARTSAGA